MVIWATAKDTGWAIQMTLTPEAEFQIDEALVRALLLSQHPDLAELPIRPLDAGWDNQMLRLGDELIVRLPRRAVAAQLIVHEQRWLPGLAARLTLPIPAPLRIGQPEFGYPWSWSILPYFDGETVDQMSLGDDQAPRLAEFLRALHQPAPADAPENPVRGGELSGRIEAFDERVARVRQHTNCFTAELERTWRVALTTEPAHDRCWLHGDLHARNLLVRDHAILAIIDWGDITAGDVATDLASVWMLLGSKVARDAALLVYGANETQRARAMGWAIMFGVMLLDTGLADHPAHEAMGRATLARVAQDVEPD